MYKIVLYLVLNCSLLFLGKSNENKVSKFEKEDFFKTVKYEIPEYWIRFLIYCVLKKNPLEYR